MMNADLKEIQKRLTVMLAVFDEYCKKHNLKYFAWGGTMLGAIRHHGFIPWDDDIDVMMPRPDYNRLMALTLTGFVDGYRIIGPHNQHNMQLAYMKMEDMNSTIVDNILAIDHPSGIFIDIMPIDGVPSDANQAEDVFMQYKKYLKGAVSSSVPYTFRNVISNDKNIKHISLLSYVKSLIYRRFYSSQYFYNKCDKLAASYDYDLSEYVRIYSSPHFSKHKMSRAWFDDTMDVVFENITIKCPAAYDKILTLLYKNYMELPPVEKRTTDHHFYFLDLERRYTTDEIKKMKGIK